MSPIIACAVLLTGASSLRVAPTMVLQPRRDLLAGGAAAAASSLLVPEAIAKKPLCLPGTNSAKALGGPGYTIGILVRGPCRIGRRLTHGSIHAGARYSELQGVAQGHRGHRPRPAVRLPPGVQGRRRVLHQDDGGQAQRPGRRARRPVFETSGLKAVKKFLGEGKNEIFVQGRRDGWLTGKWRENYFACSDFRGPTPGPPPQFQKGWGICFGAHGLGVPYKDWLKLFGSPDIDALHDSLNILYSVCGPVNGKVSTDLTGGGVGVLHVHKSYKDALRFDATFQDIKEKVKADGILKEPSRFVYGEVMNTSDDFILKGSVADTTKA